MPQTQSVDMCFYYFAIHTSANCKNTELVIVCQTQSVKACFILPIPQQTVKTPGSLLWALCRVSVFLSFSYQVVISRLFVNMDYV